MPTVLRQILRARFLSKSLGWLHQHGNNGDCDWFPPTLDESLNRIIRHWTRLREVDCPSVRLYIDTLLHFPYIPDLTTLSFPLSHGLTDRPASSDHPFVFSALRGL